MNHGKPCPYFTTCRNYMNDEEEATGVCGPCRIAHGTGAKGTKWETIAWETIAWETIAGDPGLSRRRVPRGWIFRDGPRMCFVEDPAEDDPVCRPAQHDTNGTEREYARAKCAACGHWVALPGPTDKLHQEDWIPDGVCPRCRRTEFKHDQGCEIGEPSDG